MKRPVPTKPIDDTVSRRLDRLEHLIDAEYNGSPAEFERKTEIKMTQVNQWFTGYRALRDKALARLETNTGKPKGWFDIDPLLPSFYSEVGGRIGQTFADDECLILQLSEGNVALRNEWLAEVAAFHRGRGTYSQPKESPIAPTTITTAPTLAQALEAIDAALEPLDAQSRKTAVMQLAGLETPHNAGMVAATLTAAIEYSKRRTA